MRFLVVVALCITFHNEPPRKTNAEQFNKQEQVAVKVEASKPTEPPVPQVQQPVEVKAPPPVEAPPKPQEPPQQATNGCGDNFYANYIYMHESGCRTTAVNSIGCRGIGQACPGSKLPCGADYACQNAYFTNYALQRYGSWERAYNFWVNNHWW